MITGAALEGLLVQDFDIGVEGGKLERNPFSASVTCPSSFQFGGKKESSSFQSSLAALAVVMHPTVSKSGCLCNKQVSAYAAKPGVLPLVIGLKRQEVAEISRDC